jgi:kynurenine formamidase
MERKDRGGLSKGSQAREEGDVMNIGKVYDLGQPLFAGMPHFPTHPPFLRTLTKRHGELVLPNGASSAAEAITMGGHVGTHIDALSHFSCDGKLHGGVEPVQSYSDGVTTHGVDKVEPIFRRAVLFDIARLEGVESLQLDFVVTPEHLEACGVKPAEGGIALIRTGWADYWNDASRFITGGGGSAVRGPGPKRAGAQWLSKHGIFAAGSDTVAFEHVPSNMEVHVHLLVERGIHIIECLNLESLAAAGVKEFMFIALPLKIRGGTGSPIRPVAVVE